MTDDDLLEDDGDLAGAGIPLFGDSDGDVGILPEEDDDEMSKMTIKDENGMDVEEEDGF
ncbi:MAG: hypothetical protein JWN90_433 [Parcubacteria group bacterium]|nr:hypothetical protein [Parcubacteria group bacterium]